MFQKLLDLFYPKHSLEWKDIPFRPYKELQHSLKERGLGSLDRIFSACNYHDSIVLQRAIFTLKYRRVPGLASRLADFIVLACREEVIPDIVLVPVPLHWQRHFDRGFNQAALLARRTASELDLSYANLLRRTRDTGHQAWRSRDERLASMHNAFALCRGVAVPHHIVLIDDIATTGATLDACAQVIKAAGALRVDAWVVARG
ncbi:MAG: ComF family protein [bacterium]|nr:ComF family protein [bacterium]MDA1292340.1 ComF family protein [bacterium]